MSPHAQHEFESAARVTDFSELWRLGLDVEDTTFAVDEVVDVVRQRTEKITRTVDVEHRLGAHRWTTAETVTVFRSRIR